MLHSICICFNICVQLFNSLAAILCRVSSDSFCALRSQPTGSVCAFTLMMYNWSPIPRSTCTSCHEMRLLNRLVTYFGLALFFTSVMWTCIFVVVWIVIGKILLPESEKWRLSNSYFVILQFNQLDKNI